MDDTLFEIPPTESIDRPDQPPGAPRVQRPDRHQIELRPVDLEGLLAGDHRARLVWAFVEGLDLGPLYAQIRATEGRPGRPPIDQAILTALWLYATLEAVGSARALARLCAEHDAYRWLCGGAQRGGTPVPATTAPPLMTVSARSSTVMSVSGSPVTATISA